MPFPVWTRRDALTRAQYFIIVARLFAVSPPFPGQAQACATRYETSAVLHHHRRILLNDPLPPRRKYPGPQIKIYLF
jgi:hypothetical protein